MSWWTGPVSPTVQKFTKAGEPGGELKRYSAAELTPVSCETQFWFVFGCGLPAVGLAVLAWPFRSRILWLTLRDRGTPRFWCAGAAEAELHRTSEWGAKLSGCKLEAGEIQGGALSTELWKLFRYRSRLNTLRDHKIHSEIIINQEENRETDLDSCCRETDDQSTFSYGIPMYPGLIGPKYVFAIICDTFVILSKWALWNTKRLSGHRLGQCCSLYGW